MPRISLKKELLKPVISGGGWVENSAGATTGSEKDKEQ